MDICELVNAPAVESQSDAPSFAVVGAETIVEQREWSSSCTTDRPSYDPSSPYVQIVVDASLSSFFVSYLPTNDSRLTAVFWNFERDVLRVCTIVDSDDFEFEKSVYAAELRFIERFPGVQTDFYVIPLEGRALKEICPPDSTKVFPRAA